MRVLRPILDVKEIPPAHRELRKQLPSLRSFLSPTPAPSEPLVLSYLGQGIPCGVSYDPGLLHDVLAPGRRLDSACKPNAILTDGVWLWPGALQYYVREYHLRLPGEFLLFAQGQQWRIEPSRVCVDELSSEAFDGVPSTNETAGSQKGQA